MRPWRHRTMLATVTSLATVALLAIAAGVSAQDDVDPCALLPADVVAAGLGTVGDPLGDGATYCNWSGEQSTLSLVIDAGGFDGLVASYPGGEDVDVGDVRAYRFGSADPGFSLSTVIAPMGERAIMLTVASSDPDVDAGAVALELAETALAGGGAATPASTSDASRAPEPPTGVDDWCQPITAAEVSAAIGVEVTMVPNETVAGSCGWIGGPSGQEIAIELNRLDASTIESIAASFGGAPVEGLADGAWWSADWGVLHVLAGDVAFHVAVASGPEIDAAAKQAMAVSVAEAFLAEP